MTLHSEQDAVKQAVEAGGYAPFVNREWNTHDIQKFLQDPAFWQALGKARGWHDKITYGLWEWNGSAYHKSAPSYLQMKLTQSQFYALRYFEARLSNGDLTAFWQSLP